MKLKELTLVVKEHDIKYDARETLIKKDLSKYATESCNSAEKLAEIFIKYFDLYQDEKERFVVMMFDTKLKIIGVNLVSVGNINSTIVFPLEVFRPAILAGASNIAVAHNHPSGNLEPSSDDMRVMTRLKEAGELLRIEVVDAFIISGKKKGKRFSSFKQDGIYF